MDRVHPVRGRIRVVWYPGAGYRTSHQTASKSNGSRYRCDKRGLSPRFGTSPAEPESRSPSRAAPPAPQWRGGPSERGACPLYDHRPWARRIPSGRQARSFVPIADATLPPFTSPRRRGVPVPPDGLRPPCSPAGTLDDDRQGRRRTLTDPERRDDGGVRRTPWPPISCRTPGSRGCGSPPSSPGEPPARSLAPAWKRPCPTPAARGPGRRLRSTSRARRCWPG